MMTISLDDYEKIIDRVLSGNFDASDLSEFVKNTPVLPILAKFPFGKNEAVITVIVSDKKGNPVSGAKVIIAGETQTTDADGKAIFKFPFNVPPGFVIISKGTAISRIPFNGVNVGDKITLAAVMQEGAESPLAVGESLKDVINTYYQWKLIQNVENGVFNPNLSQFPQVGILKRKSDYEYQVYVPVPVNIKVPAINFTPVVGVPGMPPQPVPPEQPTPTPITPTPTPITPIQPVNPVQPVNAYVVTIRVIPGHGAPSGAPISVSLINAETGALVAPATGSYGTYTFKNIPPGNYKVVVHSPVGLFTKNVTVTNQNVEEEIPVEAATPPPVPPAPPTPPPTPVCVEGQTKCEGHDLYTCKNNTWVLEDSNSPKCGYSPPAPPTGTIEVDVTAVLPQPPSPPPNMIRPMSLSTPSIVVEVDGVRKSGTIGRYSFSNLAPGNHVVKVYANNKLIYSETVSVSPGETKSVEVKYVPPPPPKSTIVVNVTQGSSSPSPPPYHGVPPPFHGAPPMRTTVGRIHLLGYTPFHGGASALPEGVVVEVDGIRKTGSFGKYTFNNVAVGTHTVKVYYGGKLIKSETVSVEPGQTARVLAVIHEEQPTPVPPAPPTPSSQGAIKVVVTNPTSVPVIIKIDDGKYANKEVWRGTFTFGNIPVGMHVVDIYRSGRKVYSKSVNVLPNQAVVINYAVSSAPTPVPPVHPPTPPPTPSVGGIKVVIPYTLPFDAVVKIDEGKYGTKTTRGGSVNFTNIPVGNHTVSVYRGTSRLCVQTVNVKSGLTAMVTCRPSSAPTPTPPRPPIHPGPPGGGLPVIRAI